jgi:hypothetical protein
MIIRVAASAGLAICIAAPACYAAAVTPREMRTGKVTACSKYGAQCYTAKLVRTPVGWKMRLKGGTLIHCEVTCDDTLRRATVDFWEDQRERAR